MYTALSCKIDVGSAAVVVPKPRAGDVIGVALRVAFSEDYDLPGDMVDAILLLDEVPDPVIRFR